MPVVSQQQRKFMYATEEGKANVDPSVGRDFIAASHGLRGLPARIGKPVGKRKKKAHPTPADIRNRIGKPRRVDHPEYPGDRRDMR